MTQSSKKDSQKNTKKHDKLQYNVLGKTGFLVTEAGFGTYRINNKTPEFKIALKEALKNGINLIDTSTNYADGDSEYCIGEVLQECYDEALLSRKEIIIITKAGYIQGKNLQKAIEKKENGTPYNDVIEYQSGLQHCIHPEFLKDQITDSLKRLRCDYLDVFLLHNPEYYILWAKKEGLSMEKSHANYYLRLKEAFNYLEEEVEKGRIKHYGISSNTFAATQKDDISTSLEKVIRIANDLSKNNHFSVVECPFNLIEHDTALKEESDSFLQLAKKNQLGVVTNRPFNAIKNNQLIRLIDIEDEEGISYIECDDAFESGLAYENNTKETLKKENVNEKIIQQLFCIDALKKIFEQSDSIFSFIEILRYQLIPILEEIVSIIIEHHPSKEIEIVMEGYLKEFNIISKTTKSYLVNKHNNVIETLKFQLIDSHPGYKNMYKMSHIALRSYRSTQGITSTLIGMRHSSYVRSVLEELNQPLEKSSEIEWEKLSKIIYVK